MSRWRHGRCCPRRESSQIDIAPEEAQLTFLRGQFGIDPPGDIPLTGHEISRRALRRTIKIKIG
jgi:hypothetical protein